VTRASRRDWPDSPLADDRDRVRTMRQARTIRSGGVSMSYQPTVFANQLPIVKWFIYHLIYHRVISAGYKERQMQNEFWTLTSDAHLLRATINWCMVFGTDSNPTHWKRLTSNDNNQFRDGLLNTLGISSDQWLQYWTSVRIFVISTPRTANWISLAPFPTSTPPLRSRSITISG
jgi:hypothetical protein